MNPLVPKLERLIVSVIWTLTERDYWLLIPQHRGILKTMPFPKLPDAFNTLETACPLFPWQAQAHTLAEGYVVNFFRFILPCYGKGSHRLFDNGIRKEKNAALFDELQESPLASDFFPLPEELEVAYYKIENDHLVMVLEDKSRWTLNPGLFHVEQSNKTSLTVRRINKTNGDNKNER